MGERGLKPAAGQQPRLETPVELLAECVRRASRGADFAAIWRDLLSLHPLVDGPAIAVADAARRWLEVPLSTGQRLAYRDDDGFRLVSRVALLLRERANRDADDASDRTAQPRRTASQFW
jgi:hypothetical protein